MASARYDFPLGFQITDRAWVDLGLAPVDIWSADEGVLHCILVAFKKDCGGGIEENATPLRAVDDQITLAARRVAAQPRFYVALRDVEVFRIRASDANGSYRAAVWHDTRANVIWLLRVQRISDYPGQDAENRLYQAMGAMHCAGSLLPTAVEEDAALQEQYLDAVVSALIDARVQAEADLGRWKTAAITIHGEHVVLGDAYVHAERDEAGTYVWTVVIVVIGDPPPFVRPDNWRETIEVAAFAGEEAASEDWSGLPDDRPRRGDVIPFQQARIVE